MTSLTLYPDVPCAYPNTLGANITTGVGNTSKILAVFRNDSTVPSLRGVMQRFGFNVINQSADTLVTIQFVGGVTANGGVWTPVGGQSLFDINKTATGITGGIVALTRYTFATTAHGNQPPASVLPAEYASEMGLELPVGMQFAIVANISTAGATASIAWSVNWLEKD